MRRATVATVAGIVAAGLVLAGGLTGCATGDNGSGDGGSASPEVASPLADCAMLAAPPSAAAPDGATPDAASPGATPPPGVTDPPGEPQPPGGSGPPPTPPGETGPAPAALPDLALPCFTGGEPYHLADLRGPAVVNLWASWCPPCRQELPVLQRYADQAAGRVHVVGVIVGDRPEAAASLAEDLGITFPSLADPERQLPVRVGVVGLPATLYVDAAGEITYRHLSGALDDDALAGQVREHLGVVVP